VKAVFLDRDGVLNRDGPGFVTSPEELELLPGVAEAVRMLQGAGFLTVVVTNQSAVGRGLMTLQDLQEVHDKLESELARDGATLDAIYFCPHTPTEGCTCRKPRPGMLLQARDDFGIALEESFFVGDKPTDIECGASQGCRTVLVLSGLSPEYDPAQFPIAPNHVCADLKEAAEWIVGGCIPEATGRGGTEVPS